MLYKLNTAEIESSTRVEVKAPADYDLKEQDIENFLKSRLGEIVSEDQLMLIGQERKWQEEADLLALDKDGILYIFELKRWCSEPENILQVMRYGQIFGRYSYEELEGLVKRQQKLEGKLNERHREHFHLDIALPESSFNKDQVFVLVTNGMDKDTISAVNFWSQKGVKIECSPYRIYDVDGEPYIQFDTYNPDEEVIAEENTRFFIVNTNKTYMPDAWKDMLKTGKASAYYGRKSSVCRIEKGCRVYLYHTGVGVIARGMATSDYEKTAYEGDANEEFFVPLKFDWSLSEESQWERKAPKAWEINGKWDSGYKFRQTVWAITQEMANGIDDLAKEKGTTE
ncbi:MAG: hypothetical protein OXC62_13245 [Aestuariivita sp.]|nr:hypothetical protein [Aestuariivita sp.]